MYSFLIIFYFQFSKNNRNRTEIMSERKNVTSKKHLKIADQKLYNVGQNQNRCASWSLVAWHQSQIAFVIELKFAD